MMDVRFIGYPLIEFLAEIYYNSKSEEEAVMSVALSQVLNVALALAVIYYVMGLVVSTITKLILEAFETRGKVFQEFLKRNLVGALSNGQSELLERLKKTPQIDTQKTVRYWPPVLGFITGRVRISNLVEKIPPKNLVDALFDMAGTFESQNAKVKAILALLPDQLPGLNGPVDFAAKQELVKLANQGFDNLDEFHTKLETWFTGLMEQSAQMFKAHARRIVVSLSLIVTLLFGVDSIELAKSYWKNSAVAATANAQATLILQSKDQGNNNEKIDQLIAQLDELQALNYKWYVKPENAGNDWLPMKILGLLTTTLAVSQGSSFWYDLIKRMKGDQSASSSLVSEPASDPNVIKSNRY